MEQTIRCGAPYDVEYRLINLAGETLYLRSIGRAIPQDKGAARRWFGTLQDNTPQRRMEQELRQREAHFQAYLDHTTDAITVHDTSGRIVEVNRQLCDSLGYTREELLGQFLSIYAPKITAPHPTISPTACAPARWSDSAHVTDVRTAANTRPRCAFAVSVSMGKRSASQWRAISASRSRPKARSHRTMRCCKPSSRAALTLSASKIVKAVI